MKTARRVFVNFLTLSTSELISKLIQLFVFVYLAATYGKTEFGKFGFAIAFSAIMVIIADFGINYLLIREISRDKKNVGRYVGTALMIKGVLSILTLALGMLYLRLMEYDSSTVLISVSLLIFTLLQSFTDLFYSVFRAFERMYIDSSIKVIRMLILGASVFYLIMTGTGLEKLTIAFPLTEIVMILVSVVIYVRNFKTKTSYNVLYFKKIISQAFPFFISFIFVNTLIYVDSVILQHIRGPEEVGIYAAAFNILLGLVYIPLMFSNAVYPVFSRYYVNDRSLLNFAFEKSVHYMMILGIPAAFGIFVYSNKLISLAYGPEFFQSAAVLRILSLFVVLRFVNIVPGTFLSSIDKQASRTISQGAVAFINIILNFAWIPKYGFIGAAAATVVSETLFIFLYSYFAGKEGFKIRFVPVLLKSLIASVIMTLAIYNVRNLLLGVLTGILVYSLVLILLRTFGKEDKILLDRILKNT